MKKTIAIQIPPEMAAAIGIKKLSDCIMFVWGDELWIKAKRKK